MANVATSPWEGGAVAGQPSHSFFWRRLHSLTGIVPIGGFLVFHIFENMAALRGEAAYNEGIEKIAKMVPGPYFYGIELGAILLPILFHALYGVVIAMQGKPNVGKYAYRRNFYYTLQRVSGVVALLYIVVHVGALRVGYTLLGKGGGLPGHPGYVTWADVQNHLAITGMFAFYVVGTLATIFHFTNGLNGFCWTWGIAVGEKSRKTVEYVAWGLFVAISIPTLNILYSFVR